MADLLTHALDAAGRGWPVFPCWPGSKIPALHGVDTCTGTGVCADGHRTWEQRATTDPDRIAGCWTRRPYNIGIACGPSRLVVVDLDMPKPGKPVNGHDSLAQLCARHGDLPDTWTVVTPSHGTHLYFAAPDDVELRNTESKLGPSIDTRAVGGLIVAAGSVIHRKPYHARHTPEVLAPLPAWLCGLLIPRPRPMPARVHVRVSGSRQQAWLDAAVRRQLAYLGQAGPGEGNAALFRSAVALGQLVAGGALSEQCVIDLLTQECLSVGLRPKPSTIAGGLRAGASRPRSVTV